MADLIFTINNIFIVQINRTNIALITQENEENHIKIFKEGKLKFEYTDNKISDIKFIRKLINEKFTFWNNKLVSKEIIKSYN